MTRAGGVIRRYAVVGVFMWSMSQYRAQLDFLATHIWYRVISPFSVSAAPDPNYARINAAKSKLAYTLHTAVHPELFILTYLLTPWS